MSQTAVFPSVTPRLALPLLFPGQSQKEFFFNQAISILDGLSQNAVEASIPDPPADAAEGSVYRITPTASGDWEGKENQLAVRIGGAWHFASPLPGMQVFDRSARTFVYFENDWNTAIEPPAVSGGATVDQEARAAISAIIDALRLNGTFAMPST